MEGLSEQGQAYLKELSDALFNENSINKKLTGRDVSDALRSKYGEEVELEVKTWLGIRGDCSPDADGAAR
jgi:hypothetical protein